MTVGVGGRGRNGGCPETQRLLLVTLETTSHPLVAPREEMDERSHTVRRLWQLDTLRLHRGCPAGGHEATPVGCERRVVCR